MSSGPEETKALQPDVNSDSANAQPGAIDRRKFLLSAAAGAANLAFLGRAAAQPISANFSSSPTPYDDNLTAIRAQVDKRHDEAVQRLQQWIRQPSIAAENRGVNEGCELTMQMLRDAGFNQVNKISTDGQPG